MLLPFGLKPLFKECDPPFVAMLKSRSKFFLHAKVGRTGADDEEFDDAQAGHPIERRLNRLERVSAAYRGQINLRFNNGMLVTFDSADAALALQDGLEAQVEHVRYLSLHDLLAMMAMQYQNVGLHGLYTPRELVDQ